MVEVCVATPPRSLRPTTPDHAVPCRCDNRRTQAQQISAALLRPGRFEFHLFIPYPEADDRREILRIYDAKMRLRMTPDTLEYAVRRTWHTVPGAAAGPFLGRP